MSTFDQLAASMPYGNPAAASRPTPAPSQAPAVNSRTMDELAGAMPYAQPAAAPMNAATAEQPARQRTQDELAADLYPEPGVDQPLAEVPPEVQALRDDPARRMYSDDLTYREAIPDPEAAAFAAAGMNPEQGRHAMRELRMMAGDMSLAPAEVQNLGHWATESKNNPQPQEHQQQAAMKSLRDEFGKDADQALADARKLIRRDPRTMRVLQALGLLDHPGAVLLMAKKARDARVAGHLK